MTPVHWWTITALVLFALEIFTPGFVLANFAIACLGSALAALFGFDVTVQVLVFCGLSVASFFTVRPLLNNRLIKQHFTPTGVQALIGRRVLVTEAIPASEYNGRVQVDGDSWVAHMIGDRPAAAGEYVRVVRAESNKLFVERL